MATYPFDNKRSSTILYTIVIVSLIAQAICAYPECSGNTQCTSTCSAAGKCLGNSKYSRCYWCGVRKTGENPCKNGGVCIGCSDDEVCMCRAGYGGRFCEIALTGGIQTEHPTTLPPMTLPPTTPYPTSRPPTMRPTTLPPTTEPPTMVPTTKAPTTRSPTTRPPTKQPTTAPPTTEAPTMPTPPTTSAPTKAPTTKPPTTKPPTKAPTTKPPTTKPPTTKPPTRPPTTKPPTTKPPTTKAPTTKPPTTKPPTKAPTTKPPTTKPPTTKPPTTKAPTTRSPTTKAPTKAPTTKPPTTKPPTLAPTQPPTIAPTPLPTETPDPDVDEGSQCATSVPDNLSKQEEVRFRTNMYRCQHGLKELTMNDKLTQAAYMHAKDMAENEFFNHKNLDGKTPADRVQDAGYRQLGVGENIAAGFPTAQSVLRGWEASSGHRANLLNDYFEEIGVGYYEDMYSPYRYYWVQVFALPNKLKRSIGEEEISYVVVSHGVTADSQTSSISYFPTV